MARKCGPSGRLGMANDELQLNFDRELKWCIQSLEGCLKSDDSKSRESRKVFDVLNSTKASLVRKRQVMNNHFGDYRQLMRNEEQKFPVVKPRISLIENPKSSCLFIQKRSSGNRNSRDFISIPKTTGSSTSSSFVFGFGPE